ncbi:MAG TPA: hypothetical protein DEV93_00735 [Chloroflexi bacterium]|jgi:HSP20 family protein|nr:hypothetical protein [Chloroflexota bacterium]
MKASSVASTEESILRVRKRRNMMTATTVREDGRSVVGLKPDDIDQMLRKALESGETDRKVTVNRSNLIETWGSYFLQITLPGVDPGHLEIEIVGRQAIVKGRFQVATIESGTDLWREIPSGSFEEIFRMPAEVDGDNAEAHYGHGILTIRMPKVAYLKPRFLKVQVAD